MNFLEEPAACNLKAITIQYNLHYINSSPPPPFSSSSKGPSAYAPEALQPKAYCATLKAKFSTV